ncbi:bcl-2-associated transcription factor 1 isoform X2 [Latimeria chalumnae]|uniref:BCL2 associated transcription factor 1 n=1 Tax=Latimeria chalumnae TaxID=7897 RepID=H3AD71_LATCH|nr:PREDICTED: bcl-2-associated transcription factor 1 isoform X2 [Latimeria chalumnae]|eukprot:XP_006007788.1 PREDICTED: bcl-2-associated transcription factor 1 isoform X2 [Latimeria chalumnae]
MGRSNSRTHSSRSKSQSRSSSRSRSRSPSRKKRYSSRSRSRSYSRSRSRDRNYSRDYRRDYRNNRGMRRPYGYRGRGRGYYQGGRGYYRGGYRPMWNRRYSRSPRRGRSRSRTPKRRSVSSPRSRSRSHHSDRSSVSRGSSSSRSSSCYSQSPVPSKLRSSLEKQPKKTEGVLSEDKASGSRQQEEKKDLGKFEPDQSKLHDEFSKVSTLGGDSWPGLSAYNDNSPRSHQSPSPVPTPTSHSSSRSDVALQSIAHSASGSSKIGAPTQRSHSIQRSPERAGSNTSRYSPSQDSPLHHMSSRKSPVKSVTGQSLSREEARGRSSFYSDTEEKELPKSGKYLKRYTDEEETGAYLLDKSNVKEKDGQKDRGLDKGRVEQDSEWEDQEALEYFEQKDSDKLPFLGDSEGEGGEKPDTYRQFKVSSQVEQVKSYLAETRWNDDDEGNKFKTKIVLKGDRDYDRFGEDRAFKLKGSGFGADRPSTSKEKYREDDKFLERIMIKREPVSPEQVKSEKLSERFDCSPLLQKTLDLREKAASREENLPKIKMVPSESYRPDVKLKMPPVSFDDPVRPGTSLTSDRLLASALVHSGKKEQGFRSIFDHIKLPQMYKSSAESFIQHIVSLVHHVKEHYFKSTGMTLNERFTVYQKATEGQVPRQKSPEIHRRIDISPSALRKHTRLTDEDRLFKEESQKQGDKKLRCDSADLRHDIDRRRKERSREREGSRGSRESSGSRKHEKSTKDYMDYKEYKPYKDESKPKNREGDHSRSSSSSSASRDDKDIRKEREEEFKPHHEQKEYSSFQGGNRPRGPFQFRIRGGRGRARGVFASTNMGPSNPNAAFQKRPKEEEWDPEYTPKSKKYFLHDDRDDGVDYWAKRGRGRGNFQRGRGRFNFKKSNSSPKWTHDKYQGDGHEEDDEEGIDTNEERKDRRKEEKDQHI